MKILQILLFILIIMFSMVFLYGSGSFIISFFGLLFDDLTGTDTYFMWSLS